MGNAVSIGAALPVSVAVAELAALSMAEEALSATEEATDSALEAAEEASEAAEELILCQGGNCRHGERVSTYATEEMAEPADPVTDARPEVALPTTA
jgi:hypothetical protein